MHKVDEYYRQVPTHNPVAAAAASIILCKASTYHQIDSAHTHLHTTVSWSNMTALKYLFAYTYLKNGTFL